MKNDTDKNFLLMFLSSGMYVQSSLPYFTSFLRHQEKRKRLQANDYSRTIGARLNRQLRQHKEVLQETTTSIVVNSCFILPTAPREIVKSLYFAGTILCIHCPFLFRITAQNVSSSITTTIFVASDFLLS